MARLPKALLVHRVSIRAHEGEGSAGPVLGDAKTERCYAEDKTQVATDGTGREFTSTAQVWLQLDVAAPPLSEVTLWPDTPAERVAKVGAVKRLQFPGTPSHQVIYLE